MKISEKQLFNIISESIERNLKESFDYMGGFSQFEADDDNEPKKLEKSEDGKADFNKEDEKKQQRRAQIEAFFKKDGVDVAPYAYKLYGIAPADNEDTNEMKNARSKFMKCLNHEPNEQGYPYSFTSAEINRLQSLTSNNQLNEGAETRGSIAGAALGAYYGGIKGMTTGYKIGKEVGKVVDNIKDDIKKDKENKKSKNECIKLNEAQLCKIIAESVKMALYEMRLDESFASEKLSRFVQQHQGVKNITSMNSYQKNNIDISQIPDEQIQNIVPCTQETLDNLARQIQNGVTIYFNDGTMAVIQISGNDIPSSNRANRYNQGTKDDGQHANPSVGMRQFRNKLAQSNPEAKKQMTNVLNKTRGSYNA